MDFTINEKTDNFIMKSKERFLGDEPYANMDCKQYHGTILGFGIMGLEQVYIFAVNILH